MFKLPLEDANVSGLDVFVTLLPSPNLLRYSENQT